MNKVISGGPLPDMRQILDEMLNQSLQRLHTVFILAETADSTFDCCVPASGQVLSKAAAYACSQSTKLCLAAWLVEGAILTRPALPALLSLTKAVRPVASN